MSEPIRYFNNAKEILSKAKIEDNRYVDVKYVQEACGTAYLAVLKAIDEYLITKKGMSKKELPRSVDAYRIALKRHLAVRNGKLSREFGDIYDELHIAGYYHGDLHHVDTVKGALKAAREFIDKLK